MSRHYVSGLRCIRRMLHASNLTSVSFPLGKESIDCSNFQSYRNSPISSIFLRISPFSMHIAHVTSKIMSFDFAEHACSAATCSERIYLFNDANYLILMLVPFGHISTLIWFSQPLQFVLKLTISSKERTSLRSLCMCLCTHRQAL